MPDTAIPELAVTDTVAAEPVASVIEGRVDAIQAGRIYGWAWDRSYPADRLEVEFRAEAPDGRALILGRTLADRPREDLVGGGFGDGHHAFEAELALPPDLDPSRVVAVVHAPSTGTITTFVQPPAEEQLLERTLAPHLLRIGDGVEASRREQQKIIATQQGIARLLRDLQDRVGAEQAGNSAAHAQQAAVAETLHELRERVSGLEVFLVRMDTTMRSFDDALKAKHTQNSAPIIAAGIGAAVGALLAVAIGRAVLG